MNQIGIMGGTFDPIHHGHLLLGHQAREEYHLQEIWFMPSGQPPHKKDHQVTEAQFRWEMAELALEGQEGFRLSDFELCRPGTTYTAQTLALLHEDYPDTRFYFIIGADSLFTIDQWSHPERIFPTCTILAAYRDEINTRKAMEDKILELSKTYHARIRLLVTPLMKISSHELREAVRSGKSITQWVPEPVAAYIQENHLYTGEG